MDIYLSRLMPPTRSRALVVALGTVCATMLVGCWDADPCDPGQIVAWNACMYPLPPTGSTGSGGTTGSGGAGDGSGAAGGGGS
ncbi:hypothetical protein [Sorangium sp. So ce362]|uniref:hypothetical protein n=1 Tax=Sorangium sp. So ce362 TaxID=3133303 RepID=UPI003F6151AD